jgi:hypothetical protein
MVEAGSAAGAASTADAPDKTEAEAMAGTFLYLDV